MAPPTSATTQAAFSVLMFFAGIGIPIMAAMNAGIAARIGSPAAAATILFLIGAAVSAIAAAFTLHGLRLNLAATPPQYLAAGLLVAFYLLSITYAAPRIGIGNAVFFVLLGQLIAAAAIDHFGLFGAVVSTITWRRVAGIAVMAVGVFLARKMYSPLEGGRPEDLGDRTGAAERRVSPMAGPR